MVLKNRVCYIFILCLIPFSFVFCSKEDTIGSNCSEAQGGKPLSGTRIAWDYSTMKQVSSSDGGVSYSGYPRMAQLPDGTLICVYEADGNIVTVKSNDEGTTWSAPAMIAEKENSTNMSVPDILVLNDQSILVCYNPRPFEIDPSRRFAIRTKKSYDNGATWTDERLLYEAGFQFENGCWEPSAIQLPDGEIQLFFANEGRYDQSNEQNISLLRSFDNGLTWTDTPEIVSFRAGFRDGMPSPLLLKNGKDIVVAIEDNGRETFKPYTVRSSVTENWKNTVTAEHEHRHYALAHKINDFIYAGAPYLAQLKGGETLLSYQGTENRPNDMSSAEMKVVIGNEEAFDFDRKTVPFPIPADKSGLWNSITVLDDNTIVALTSTKAYSDENKTEVWMIKGYVIPEIEAYKSSIAVDGLPEETIWKEDFPIFIGHKGLTHLKSKVTYDDQNLYILTWVKDENVVTTQANPENNDGTTIYLDLYNKANKTPGKDVFKVSLTAGNNLIFSEGNSCKWMVHTIENIKYSSKITEFGYLQELAIPWSLMGDKPEQDSRIGLNMRLTESNTKGAPAYKENISCNNEDQPFTWLTLRLK